MTNDCHTIESLYSELHRIPLKINNYNEMKVYGETISGNFKPNIVSAFREGNSETGKFEFQQF